MLTGGCLLLNESSAESSSRSFLHYSHAVLSNHGSEKPKICLVLYGHITGLTVSFNTIKYPRYMIQ